MNLHKLFKDDVSSSALRVTELLLHHYLFTKHIGNLQGNGLVTVTYAEGKIEVTIPNLLKYRDEYSRKSGANQEGVRTKKQRQIQSTDTEKEKQTKRKLFVSPALEEVQRY